MWLGETANNVLSGQLYFINSIRVSAFKNKRLHWPAHMHIILAMVTQQLSSSELCYNTGIARGCTECTCTPGAKKKILGAKFVVSAPQAQREPIFEEIGDLDGVSG